MEEDLDGKAAPRKRGRPPELVPPPRIDATPEQVAFACMQGPPKKDWDYLKPGSSARRKPPTKRAE